MKSIGRAVSLFVVAPLLLSSTALADNHTLHVSVLKHGCSHAGYCARMSNDGMRTMGPPIMTAAVRFNEVDGEPTE